MIPQAQPQQPGLIQGAQQPQQQGGDAMQRVLLAAQKVLYSPETTPGVVNMLRSGDPVQALAQADLFILKALFDESKGTMPKEVIAPAAAQVMPLLAELAQAAGVKVAPQQVQQAAQIVQQRLQKHLGGAQQAAPATPQQPEAPAEAQVESEQEY